jgi:ABC-type sugar transport system ATPase subunit
MGVSIMYQEFNLLPKEPLPITFFLPEPGKMGVIDMNQMNLNAHAVLKEMGVESSSNPALVSSLPGPTTTG